VALARPRQWIKNLFILIPAIFLADSIELWDALELIITFFSFCLFSSSVYVVNDIIDSDKDRLHPRKKLRPVASGKVSVLAAAIFGASLFFLAILLASAVKTSVTLIGCAYCSLNIIYSFYAKHIPLADVFFIASGFILRVYAGGAAIAAPISPWLMLNTLFLSLFLGFGKRRSELIHSVANPSEHRSVLGKYTPEMLNFFLISSCAMVLVCYSLYTIDSGTVRAVGSTNLVYTVPVATYGLFRYVFVLFRKSEDLDIAEIVLSDRAILLAAVMWLALVFLIITHG
jgi:4-hydroxybenzoate polyprenyltransferase